VSKKIKTKRSYVEGFLPIAFAKVLSINTQVPAVFCDFDITKGMTMCLKSLHKSIANIKGFRDFS
jgi:hypothetical protein